jgi:Transglutaminase-like superfamily/TgpA N-terminal domain
VRVAKAAARTIAAAALPSVAIVVSWGRLEDPRLAGELVLVAVLAIVPALARPVAARVALLFLSLAAAAWVAFGAQPWELLPYRDERVLAPLFDAFGAGVGDYYDILLPFDPARRPEMHGVLALAVFGFVAAIALLVAARRPLAAAAVTIAGAGWPATLLDDAAVAVGTLALAGALSIALVLRARSVRTLVGGLVVAALVVGGAAWVSSATSFTREAVVDWQAWNVRGPAPRALGVRFVWEARYDGIAFPPTTTEVLRITGSSRAQYWRASALDEFIADRWYEDPSLVLSRGTGKRLVRDPLAPDAARDESTWLEQHVEVRALVDDRLVAAGTPVSVEAPSLGTLFTFASGMVRAQRTLPRGTKYTVWSYVPDPAPAALEEAPARYPRTARRFIALWGRELPWFGAENRAQRVDAILDDPSYANLGAYRPLYERARGLTQRATSPYAAVLALESWLRQRGGFTYNERPPVTDGPPLVNFVTTSKAGYCQHFAGAMAVMARLLGIPARVAVGFTSGRLRDGAWVVNDHDAHAWVEVWFAGHGWVPFDPTPGRGTFSTSYSFASDSPETVAALRRGSLDAVVRAEERGDLVQGLDTGGADAGGDRPSILTIALVLSALGALAIGLVKWLRRRVGYLTTDPRRVAAATRNELEWFLRDQGVVVPRSATLEDLRRAVGEKLGFDAGPFVAQAGRARFGAPSDTRLAARRARGELRSLLRAVRGELSVAARARGFVSLRSLRGWQG